MTLTDVVGPVVFLKRSRRRRLKIEMPSEKKSVDQPRPASFFLLFDCASAGLCPKAELIEALGWSYPGEDASETDE